MAYEIPEEEEVKRIILKILHMRGVVESQAELHREVMKHLERKNKNYRLSGRRMRIIALNSGHVGIEIRYRLTDKEVESFEICPVCGSKMVKISNSTLDGSRVIIGFRCTGCPYWTGKRLRVPVRYVFRYKK